MPRLPIDYNKTVMYKFVCNDLNVRYVYVGHTTDFINRKRTHKSNCNNETSKKHNLKVYKIIRDNEGWDNWKMIIIEEYPCLNVTLACIRERELYEELNANMNTHKPYATDTEKQECIKTQGKQYYNDNRLTILERKKQYHQDNREQRLDHQKQYHLEHKAKIAERDRLKYLRNKATKLANLIL